MVCPLLSIVPGKQYTDCMENECAWWDKQPGHDAQCAILTMAHYIKKIPINIAAIGEER